MSYKTEINNLKPIEYKESFKNLSNESFMLYAALVLEEKGIPLTFSYLCISTFKLFPQMFPFDEEFQEYPAGEKLNRTYMHLKYTGAKPACIAGVVETGFNLTQFGRQKAEIAKIMIDTGEIVKRSKTSNKKGDTHKQGYNKYKNSFLESKGFKEYSESGKISKMWIYSFFDVAPFSQTEQIKTTLNQWLTYAKEDNNIKCIEFINKLLSTL